MQHFDPKIAFDFLAIDDHERVIFGVIKRLGVNKQHHYYDDFVQEGRLIFISAYEKFPGNVTVEEEKFMVFAYQRIYWHLLDLLRRQSQQISHHEFSLDNELIPTEIKEAITLDPTSKVNQIDQLVNDDFFIRLFPSCSTNERRFLLDAVLKQKTNIEIARHYQVSKQAVSKWKRQVQRKAQEVIEDQT